MRKKNWRMIFTFFIHQVAFYVIRVAAPLYNHIMNLVNSSRLINEVTLGHYLDKLYAGGSWEQEVHILHVNI